MFEFLWALAQHEPEKKNQTLRQDEASLLSFGLSLTISSHAPHLFHLHPESSEVPFSNTTNLVCTAWSWCWVGWDLESRGPCRYRPPWQWWGEQGRARHHADGAGISDSDCWRGVNSLVWEQISPVSGVSLCLCFTFSHSSQWRNEHRWLRGERKSERGSQCDCVCACVSVSDCWLLEYKWDVLIHLNQGHMLGPRVKCSERNEALYCICHSAQEIKPGTFSALHEILRVTFKQSVVINWLHDWPDCKSFSYFHVHDIFVVSRKKVIFGLFSFISSMFCNISSYFLFQDFCFRC